MNLLLDFDLKHGTVKLHPALMWFIEGLDGPLCDEVCVVIVWIIIISSESSSGCLHIIKTLLL